MAHARIPKLFQTMLRYEMEAAIEQANLGREDTVIATLYLIDHIPQIEIAIELNIDRKTVYSRMSAILQKVEQTARRLHSP